MPFKFEENMFLKEFETTVLSCERGTEKLPICDDRQHFMDEGYRDDAFADEVLHHRHDAEDHRDDPQVRCVGHHRHDAEDHRNPQAQCPGHHKQDTELISINGYYVICEDTILYPEFAGQQCDHGTINGHPVRCVRNTDKGVPVHFVEMEKPFEVGSTVKQILDWDRRWDNMQQHTGQHFLTALFEMEFQFHTKVCILNKDLSYLVMPGHFLVNREKMDIIERKANQIIREGREVSIERINHMDNQGNPIPRGAPFGKANLLRVIRIRNFENVVCHGTHLTNLSQLQCVKIVNAEGFGGLWLVHYLIGERVIRKLGESVEREQSLKLSLNDEPDLQLKSLEQLQRKFKNVAKSLEKVIRDFAEAEAEKVETLQPRPQFYCLHRAYGILPYFINIFLDRAPRDIFYFLTIYENDNKGLMVLRGERELIQKFGDTFLNILDGEKIDGVYFQGNIIYNEENISECEALLEQHFNMGE